MLLTLYQRHLFWKTEWINYDINLVAAIYQKQSRQDLLMSQSFDIFFQTKDEYFFAHIPNTEKTAIKLRKNLSKIEAI